jgi:hypothetical protein
MDIVEDSIKMLLKASGGSDDKWTIPRRFWVCGGILDWLRPNFPDEKERPSARMAA